MNANSSTSSETFSVRRFEARDIEAVIALLSAGVMYSHSGTTTVDLSPIIKGVAAAIAGKHPVWVAESSGRIIGVTVGICDGNSLAHLRCLCVAHDIEEPHVVVQTLTESAIKDAWECGYVKLIVHTDMPLNQLTATFHDLGFEFSRDGAMGSEHTLEFYLNLYERPPRLLAHDTKENQT